MTNKQYQEAKQIQFKFADVVMELIGNEIDRLDAFVYADKYMEYFGVNDSKCFIRYYNKALERNKTIPSDCKNTLIHDLMLTRDRSPELCVPRTAYTI